MSAPRLGSSWAHVAGVAVPHVIGSSLVLGATASLLGDWRPTGDVAAIAVRAGDTFSRQVPLVGMPSTAGGGLHHPGPLQFWATALSEAVVGGRVGALMATAVINVAAIAVIVTVGRRLGRVPGSLVAAAGCFILSWSLYGPMLVSPFNPNAAVFPFAAGLAAGVASAVRPARWTVACAVLLGSYAAQAHLVFAPLVLAAAVPLTVMTARSARPHARRSLAAVAVAVAGLAWIGPIVDVVVHDGGNLRALVDVFGQDQSEATAGLGRGATVVAGALAPMPLFLERGVSGAEVFGGGSAVAVIVVLAGGSLLVVQAVGRREARPVTFVVCVTTVVLALTSVVAIGLLPSVAYNTFALHNYLPLWVVSIAAWGLVLAMGVDALDRSRALPATRSGLRWVTPVASAVGLLSVTAMLALLPRPSASADMAYTESLAEQLDGELSSGHRVGPHLVVVHDDLVRFGVEAGLVRALSDAGHDIVVPNRVGNKFGFHRVVAGPAPTFTLVAGPAPSDARDVDVRDVVARFRPDESLVRRREAAIATLTDTVVADRSSLGNLAHLVTDRRSIEEFVRNDLAHAVASGFPLGAVEDMAATEVLVSTDDEPWRAFHVVAGVPQASVGE